MTTDSLTERCGVMEHRNVQGLAFDHAGRLGASEFGPPSTTNAIGSNQEPISTGGRKSRESAGAGVRDERVLSTRKSPGRRVRPPPADWPGSTVCSTWARYVASVSGRSRSAVIQHRSRTAALEGELGRIRTVVVAPDGDLWLTTSNTDGRGDPRDGDDRVVSVSIG